MVMPLSVWWEILRKRHHFADAAHFGQGQFGLPSDIAVNLPGGQQHREYALTFAVDKLNLGNFIVGLIESSNSLGKSKGRNDNENDDRIKEKMSSLRSDHRKISCKVFVFNAGAFFMQLPFEKPSHRSGKRVAEAQFSAHEALNQIQRRSHQAALLKMMRQQACPLALGVIDQDLPRRDTLDHLHQAAEIQMIAELDGGV